MRKFFILLTLFTRVCFASDGLEFVEYSGSGASALSTIPNGVALMGSLKEKVFAHCASKGITIRNNDKVTFYCAGHKGDRELMPIQPGKYTYLSFIQGIKPSIITSGSGRPEIIQIPVSGITGLLNDNFLSTQLDAIVDFIKLQYTSLPVANQTNASSVAHAKDRSSAPVTSVTVPSSAGVNFLKYSGPGASDLGLFPDGTKLMSDLQTRFAQLCIQKGRPITASDNFTFYCSGYKGCREFMAKQQGKYAYVSFCVAGKPSARTVNEDGARMFEVAISSEYDQLRTDGRLVDSLNDMFNYFDSVR